MCSGRHQDGHQAQEGALLADLSRIVSPCYHARQEKKTRWVLQARSLAVTGNDFHYHAIETPLHDSKTGETFKTGYNVIAGNKVLGQYVAPLVTKRNKKWMLVVPSTGPAFPLHAAGYRVGQETRQYTSGTHGLLSTAQLVQAYDAFAHQDKGIDESFTFVRSLLSDSCTKQKN